MDLKNQKRLWSRNRLRRSSTFGKNTEFKMKKAGHFPNTETEVRPRTANTMPENVRQDVKTQSYRVQFTSGIGCKQDFYLVGFSLVC